MIGVTEIDSPRGYKALDAYREYMAAFEKTHDERDRILAETNKALYDGKRLINLHDAIWKAGLDSSGRPRLAITRSHARRVYCHNIERKFQRVCRFSEHVDASYTDWAKNRYVDIPASGFGAPMMTRRIEAVVPIVPPHLRPRGNPRRYHILWEAEWQGAPVDPMLLRHLTGPFYAILAVWNLTEIERSVLTLAIGDEG